MYISLNMQLRQHINWEGGDALVENFAAANDSLIADAENTITMKLTGTQEQAAG